jgi:hypothetical protein
VSGRGERDLNRCDVNVWMDEPGFAALHFPLIRRLSKGVKGSSE